MFSKNVNELPSYMNQSLQGHFQNYTAVMQEVNIGALETADSRMISVGYVI